MYVGKGNVQEGTEGNGTRRWKWRSQIRRYPHHPVSQFDPRVSLKARVSSKPLLPVIKALRKMLERATNISVEVFTENIEYPNGLSRSSRETMDDENFTTFLIAFMKQMYRMKLIIKFTSYRVM